MNKPTKKELERCTLRLYSVALKAVRKAEGYSDGSGFSSMSDRGKTALRAIAEYVLKGGK